MFMYAVVLLCAIVMWLISLHFDGYSIFAPAPLFMIGLTISAALAMVGFSTWNRVLLQPEVVLIVLAGSVSFVTASIMVQRVPPIKDFKLNGRANAGNDSDNSWVKYAVFALIMCLAICLRVYETMQISDQMGLTGAFSERVNAVRNVTDGIFTSESIKMEHGFSFFEKQLEKVAVAIGYVSVSLIAADVARGNRNGRTAWSFVLLILSVLFALLKGSRTEILYYLLAGVVVWFILKARNIANARSFAIKVLVGCLAGAAIAAVGFYAIAPALGRNLSSGLVEYISFYFGGALSSFQELLQETPNQVSPGSATFYGMFSLLYKLGIIDNLQSYSLSWIDVGGHSSNIFTCFARYYLDFGYIGVVLLSAASGAILSVIYRCARCYANPALLAVAGYLGAFTFDMVREEFVFSRLMGTTYLITIALIVLVTCILTRPIELKRLQKTFKQSGDEA